MEYTAQAKRVIKEAKNQAKNWGHLYVGTEHLLLALTKVYTGVAGQVLGHMHVTEDKVSRLIEQLVAPKQEKAEKIPPISPRLLYIWEQSEEIARTMGMEQVGTEHLLLAILDDSDSIGAKILGTLGVSTKEMVSSILVACGENPQDYQMEAEPKKETMLKQFSRDLTLAAREGQLDPVIGREKEMERLMQILSRRTKNNPCLIGEPGVGKTAVIEGLALRIAKRDVPQNMENKRILALDLSAMIAGSKYRGEFEERMKRMMKEVMEDGDTILFVDEVHTLIGAGGAEGAMDASNILKPALSRGEIQLIGATTVSEYRKYIEKDAALERRFQPILIEEPSEQECFDILWGLRSRYEKHHQVTIEKEALWEAIYLSKRYIHGRYLPDKAIDVIDEASSKVSLGDYQISEGQQKLEKEIEDIKANEEGALLAGDFEQVLKTREMLKELEEKWQRMKKREARRKEKSCKVVTGQEIAEVVAMWTRIPLAQIKESEAQRLKKLEATLHKRVIGQTEAVQAVARAVRRGRVGLKNPQRPVGSFLFLGPTGVGKTELSKALAQAMFGEEEAMIRIDMSEYMEKHSVSKMIGSPPGYIGHEEGGQLCEKVRQNPYSVILFDEIEKAHPDVFNILLQVLDDGRITDSQGRTVDFRNTILILTSNVGAKSIVEPKRLGFIMEENKDADYMRMKEGVMEEVRKLFRPEFLNRIDEIIVFHSLEEEHMKKIVQLMCKELEERAKKELDLRLTIRESVKKKIVAEGSDKKYGARPLRRTVQKLIEDGLAEAILAGDIQKGMDVIVTVRGKKVIFEPKKINV